MQDCLDSSSSDDNSIHGSSKSWNHAEDCPDNCHHDSGFHENTVLHIDTSSDDESDEWSHDQSCDSMYDTEDESDEHASN